MLDLRKLFRPKAESVQGTLQFDFSARDFEGFEVPQAVQMCYTATPQGNGVQLAFMVEAEVCALCSRCLQPARQQLIIDGAYSIREEELAEEFPQLPILPNGLLNLEELAYGELVIETPASILCSEDCAGLCQRCGLPRDQCQCPPETEGDPRLQVLRSLLQPDEAEDE